MKNKFTEMVFILDRSGSMAGLESDTIGGFNALISKQKKEPGTAFVTTVLFNDGTEMIHDRLNIEAVPVMTEREYTPGGCTALLDAVGGTIDHIVSIHRYIRPEDVPEKTVVVLMTDGLENASHQYTLEQIRKKVEHEREKYDWEFLFLGADINAVDTATGIGIHASRAANFMHDDRGIDLCFDAMSHAITSVQRRKPIPESWRASVERDHNNRK